MKIDFNQQRTNYKETGGTLKTKAVYRSIFVHEELFDICQWLIEDTKQLLINNNKPIPINSDYFIFLNEQAKPITLQYLNSVVKKVADICEMKNIHPHLFRHFFAHQSTMTNANNLEVMPGLVTQTIK